MNNRCCKKMFEQMFLQGNIHAKDQMMAKDMCDRLKEFTNNGELEQDEAKSFNNLRMDIMVPQNVFGSGNKNRTTI